MDEVSVIIWIYNLMTLPGRNPVDVDFPGMRSGFVINGWWQDIHNKLDWNVGRR